ncbi:MAG TPA: lysophospholipid acyltransferase family protein [Blastocatellia bacterium]|jgi:1-acyl-sn-glycerol-3-phosphate acyltransferase|nr:lysophospholipid acyltransferase family protein [Blastocatellia bacterium]
MLRYYWTFVVAFLLLVFIGGPAIAIGHILRKFFGVEDFIFPPAKFGLRVYVWAAGARAHVYGIERLDPDQAYVFIANHQSNLDPPLLFSYLGHNVGAIAKIELFRIPIMKQGLPLAHVVPVDRRDRGRAIQSARRGADELRAGHSLMAFPEGTRSTDGRVKDFKKGAFYMAIEAGVPIAPVVINDTRLVMPRGEKRVVPGDVYVEVLPPVGVEGYTRENVGELIKHVRDLIVLRVRTD